MQCEACFKWFHLSPCCNIDNVKYTALEENDLLDVVRWFCKACDQNITQIVGQLSDIKARLCALEQGSKMEDMVKNKMQECFQEQIEIDKRKSNIIIQGLPESPAEIADEDGEMRPTTSQERKAADICKLAKLKEIDTALSTRL